jgi:serine/threonine protein kinase
MRFVATRFGRYELLRPLGKGGMAEVYLARYAGPQGFEKRLVIKRVLGRLADNPRFLRMFFEEARTQVSLSHGNLVSVFDFGRVGNDYFIAMEHVRGADLAAVLAAERAGGLEPALVAHLGVELCRALAYVHRKGFVHRDVSPRNVLVSADGEVKLSDFGLAHELAGESATRVGGTPAYVAPELARGERADGRSDLYSLGLVLAEALLGRVRPVAPGDAASLLADQARASLPSLGALGALLSRAVQDAPEDRFESADAMLAALERELAASAVSRESLVRELASRLQPLAPRPQDDDSSVSCDQTAVTVSEGPGGRESYFTDHRAADFIDDVIERKVASPPRPGRRRLSRAIGGAALVAAGVLIAKTVFSGRAAEPVPVAATGSPGESPTANAVVAGPAAPLPAEATAGRTEPASPTAPPAAVRAAGRRDVPARARPPGAAATGVAGVVRIRCTPWCVPYLDGAVRGIDGRTFLLRDVTAGRHQIEVRRLDDRQTRELSLDPGEQRDVVFTFD